MSEKRFVIFSIKIIVCRQFKRTLYFTIKWDNINSVCRTSDVCHYRCNDTVVGTDYSEPCRREGMGACTPGANILNKFYLWTHLKLGGGVKIVYLPRAQKHSGTALPCILHIIMLMITYAREIYRLMPIT